MSAEAIRIAAATADEPDDPDADAGHWRRLAWLSREAISPLARLEHALHPWSSFVVIPIFALANAGIVLDGSSLEAATETRVALAVALGLVIGKIVGITAGVALATRLRLSSLPPQVGWSHMAGSGRSRASASRSPCSCRTSPTPTPTSWRRRRWACWRVRSWPPSPASRSSS